jgi:dipeptidyl aminopeptidase/acylaminoacyl peptidase
MPRFSLWFWLALAPSVAAARPLTLTDQFETARLSDLHVSPDGERFVFTVTTLDPVKNGRHVDVYIMPVAGGTPKRLTTAGQLNEEPSWAPDSRHIVYTSDRSGSAQLWTLDVNSGAESQLTRAPLGASGGLWSPSGKLVVFAAEVFPDCKGDAKCMQAREDAAKKGPREFDHLFVRHWKTWSDGRLVHLFAIDADKPGSAARDLTPVAWDAPSWRLHEPLGYAVSADSRAVVFSAKDQSTAKASDQAWTTNADLFRVPLAGGPLTRLTTNPADDATPRLSPDGKFVAWRAQARPGYESDRWRLMVMRLPEGPHEAPRKSSISVRPTEIASGFDRWVSDLAWAPDSQSLLFVAEDRGTQVLYRLSAQNYIGEPKEIYRGLSVDDFAPLPHGSALVVGSRCNRFPEIYRVDALGTATTLSAFNAARQREVELAACEPLEAKGADGVSIHGFVLKPPGQGMKAGVRHPLLVFIHGGPQGAWDDDFGSIRWSPQLYAARGYVVATMNPRGSTGWGQNYIDGVNRDWGGKPYDDIMRLYDAATKLPFVDEKRACALGASFGGFMVNWIQGHTDRFRCLVAHAGLFDQWSMYFQTEELWFPEWEFGGTPWQAGDMFDRQSPSHYAGKFRTPELVTHGELDFRVPYGEGLGMFTALQRRGVESKLMLFPDEGHWIAKPANLERWLGAIWAFLDAHLKKG